MYIGKASPIVILSGKNADKIFLAPKRKISREKKKRVLEIARKNLSENKETD